MWSPPSVTDAAWQSNYNFTSAFYTFGALRYEHDLFSGFEYQGSATAGIGYQIFNTARTKLSVQLGAGDRNERPELLAARPAPLTGYDRTLLARQNGAIGTAGLDVTQVITSTTTLTDTGLVESGGGNTLITDTFAITVKVSTKLALSLGYNLQDNTNPPRGP